MTIRRRTVLGHLAFRRRLSLDVRRRERRDEIDVVGFQRLREWKQASEGGLIAAYERYAIDQIQLRYEESRGV
jgi:hypothetical protein